MRYHYHQHMLTGNRCGKEAKKCRFIERGKGNEPIRTKPDLKKHSPGKQRTFSSSINFCANAKVSLISFHFSYSNPTYSHQHRYPQYPQQMERREGEGTIAYKAPCGSMTCNPGALANSSTITLAFPFNSSTTSSKNSCGVSNIVGNAV